MLHILVAPINMEYTSSQVYKRVVLLYSNTTSSLVVPSYGVLSPSMTLVLSLKCDVSIHTCVCSCTPVPTMMQVHAEDVIL